MLKLKIKKGHHHRLKLGHLWVFSNELELIPDLEAGSIVEVVGPSGESFGKGFFNPSSLIAVRLLNTMDEIDTNFFRNRIADAFALRTALFPEEPCYRLVFGESDFLPGLVADRYGDYLSVQYLSAGIDFRKEMILEALLTLMPEIKGIYEKNNSRLRELEQLPLVEQAAWGTIPDRFETSDRGLKISIKLSSSQKTGYYLDQRLNRDFTRAIAKGRKVLDCFTNQGAFALNCAAGNAEFITGVDISGEAVNDAIQNASANNFGNMEFIKADVFDFLKEAPKNEYDMIILDPPAFAKSRKQVQSAKTGYAKINSLAIKLLPKGGILISSSCSQHVLEEVFFGLINKEALKSGRKLRLLFRGMQTPDHPILPSMPETKYLKFFAFQVL